MAYAPERYAWVIASFKNGHGITKDFQPGFAILISSINDFAPVSS